MKLPAFQFYPGDWRKDIGVQSLSYHDRGVWWEMLCLMHESENRGLLILNGRPMSDEVLARTLGLDKQILTTTITTLLELGVASKDEPTGALMCRRMVRDENLRQIRTEAGKKGGNPVLLNQKPTTGVKQSSTPSSSVSSSSSKQLPIPEWIPLEAWEAFVEMRKKIKKPLTPRAIGLAINCLSEFRSKGYNVEELIDAAVLHNWQSFYLPKDANGQVIKPKVTYRVATGAEFWKDVPGVKAI